MTVANNTNLVLVAWHKKWVPSPHLWHQQIPDPPSRRSSCCIEEDETVPVLPTSLDLDLSREELEDTCRWEAFSVASKPLGPFRHCSYGQAKCIPRCGGRTLLLVEIFKTQWAKSCFPIFLWEHSLQSTVAGALSRLPTIHLTTLPTWQLFQSCYAFYPEELEEEEAVPCVRGV